MTTRSKWLGLAISFGVMLSLVIMTVATASAARTGSKGHGKSHAKAAACKKVKASGTIRYSDWQFPDNLNPVQTGSAASFETITLMQVSDIVYDQKARLVPEALAKIPSLVNGGVKNGGKTIIEQLRPNQHWSNGALMTSKDIKFAWQVESTKISGPYCSGTCDAIGSITLPSKYTAVLHLKKVFAPAVPSAFPGEWPYAWKGGWKGGDYKTAATKLFKDQSWTFDNSSFPSNGPYQVKSFVPGNRIVLKPMKYFRRGNVCGAPTATYQFAFYSDQQPMIDAAATGATDITEDYTEANYGALAQGQRAHHKYKVSSVPSFFIEHLEFNHDKTYNGHKNPFADARVRLAFSLALDKVAITRGALQVSKSAASKIVAFSPWLITPSLVQPFANTSIRGVWDPYGGKNHKGAFVTAGSKQAIKDAKTLMKKAGYAHGFTFDHFTTKAVFRGASAAIMASQLRSRLGVSMVIHQIASTTSLFATWTENGVLKHGKYQTAEFGYVGGPEPNSWRYNMMCRYVARHSSVPTAATNSNDSAMCNRTIDADFNKGTATLSTGLRAKYYKQIQAILAKEADWDPLYYRSEILTVGNGVKNFKNVPVGTQTPAWNWWELKK